MWTLETDKTYKSPGDLTKSRWKLVVDAFIYQIFIDLYDWQYEDGLK